MKTLRFLFFDNNIKKSKLIFYGLAKALIQGMLIVILINIPKYVMDSLQRSVELDKNNIIYNTDFYCLYGFTYSYHIL